MAIRPSKRVSASSSTLPPDARATRPRTSASSEDGPQGPNLGHTRTSRDLVVSSVRAVGLAGGSIASGAGARELVFGLAQRFAPLGDLDRCTEPEHSTAERDRA